MKSFRLFRLIASAASICAGAAPGIGAQQLVTPRAPDTLYLSLDSAVTRAVRSSNEARLAQASIDAADAQLTVSRSSLLPQLRVTGNYTKTLESARSQAVGQIFNQPNTYTTNANLSQTLFQGGRELAGMRSSSRLEEAASYTANETRAQISVNIQRAYLQVLFTERMLEIQTQNLALSTARLAQVEQLEAAGRAARYDVLRARVERANLEPAVLQAKADHENALLDLKRQLDIPMERPVALTTLFDPAGLDAVVTSLVSDTRSAARVRPVIRAAEATVSARRSAITVARADMLPTVSVFVSNGYSAFPQTGLPPIRGQLANQFCPTGSAENRTCNNGGFFTDRSLGLQVSWPLFDGLRAKGNVEAARAAAKIADIQLEQTRENVALEQARAMSELERARSAFQARHETVTQANEAFQLANLRFSRGLGTQLEVSDAQIALLTAETTEARASFDLYLAAAELARTRGLPIPMPPTRPAPGRTSSPNTPSADSKVP